MNSAKDHYARLLAAHYSWMFGDFDAKVAEQKALFESLGLGPAQGARALDLGCGSGFQSFALAELGYALTAVDSSPALLAELEEHTSGQAIRTVEADLLDLAEHVREAVDLIVCMGDTLTHLGSFVDVEWLFERALEALTPGGRLVLTFRDLSRAAEGLDRFIPLRSTPEKIMTCFLEYGAHIVTVHDLIHIKEGETWRLEKSCYRKLRLSADCVADMLESAGYRLAHRAEEKGLVTLLAARA
jgi:SAM-dependent methyltransferase